MSAGGTAPLNGRPAREGRLGGVGWSGGKPDPRYSRSLETGLAILASFDDKRRVQGIADVAEELDLGRSTTHRYMKTLAMLGHMEQAPGPKYSLAPRAADIGQTALESVPVREGSWGHLKGLRDETGLTVSLGILWGSRVLYLGRARGWQVGQHEIDMGIPGLSSGWRLPAHLTSLGKLLLAQLPTKDLAELLRRIELRRGGPRAITTKAAFGEELERIRGEGFALSDRELTGCLVSIAAPVKDPDGAVVAAVCLEAHATGVTAERLAGEFASRLTAVAAHLSQKAR